MLLLLHVGLLLLCQRNHISCTFAKTEHNVIGKNVPVNAFEIEISSVHIFFSLNTLLFGSMFNWDWLNNIFLFLSYVYRWQKMYVNHSIQRVTDFMSIAFDFLEVSL